MEHLFILSNGGSGVYWWTPASDGGTERLQSPPAPYIELQQKKCFHRSAPGIYVFATESGRACLLVSNLYSGRSAGNAIVFESILFVAPANSLTNRMKSCAAAYLSSERQQLTNLGIEERQLSALAPLTSLIQPSHGLIRVDWQALYHSLDTLPAPVANEPEPDVAFALLDTPPNREKLRGLLAAVQTVPAGTLLAAVIAGLEGLPLEANDVRWCLADELPRKAALPEPPPEPDWQEEEAQQSSSAGYHLPAEIRLGAFTLLGFAALFVLYRALTPRR
jgi:hypothetical protein